MNYNPDSVFIIMAAGLGKRMNSSIPKVLHKVNNRPMLITILEKCIELYPYKICIIVNNKNFGIINEYVNYSIPDTIIKSKIKYIIQENQFGTGDAILSCNEYLLSLNSYVKKVLILSGDVPLISCSTIVNLLKNLNNANILTTYIDNPYGYGRVIIDNNIVKKIIEEKDCSESEKKNNLINSGIYAFNINILCKYITKLDNNNNQNEYYLTQIFEKINKDNITINYIVSNNSKEVLGVNTIDELNNIQKFC